MRERFWTDEKLQALADIRNHTAGVTTASMAEHFGTTVASVQGALGQAKTRGLLGEKMVDPTAFDARLNIVAPSGEAHIEIDNLRYQVDLVKRFPDREDTVVHLRGATDSVSDSFDEVAGWFADAGNQRGLGAVLERLVDAIAAKELAAEAPPRPDDEQDD